MRHNIFFLAFDLCFSWPFPADMQLPAADFVRNHEQQPKIKYGTNNGQNGINENGLSYDNESSATASGEDEPDEDDKIRSLNPNGDGDDVGSFLYLEGVEYIMWCTWCRLLELSQFC